MPKMKHLLRKLHIGGGGGGGFNDHNHRLTSTDTPSQPPATAQFLSPSSPSPIETVDSYSVHNNINNSNSSVVDFNFFEDEFQMQLALAISVSSGSGDTREPDAETAQIKAAKQRSLGFYPSESLVEFLSLRYWSNNVVNYDERVMDGFYDVYGISSNLVTQGKMPSLVDLQSKTVYDDVDYDVILVDRTIDKQLQYLEERVSDISMECQATGMNQVISRLIERIADIVVAQMGGPVSDADDMCRNWTVRSHQLRNTMKTIILPLGCIDCGLSRHRALLFKVLADKVNLACSLVKGSYYTGTDDGAVNLIKIDNGSEYIIDLMGAPGTLIPVELQCNFQSIELDIRSDAGGAGSFGYTLPLLDISTDPLLVTHKLDGFAKVGLSDSAVASIIGSQLRTKVENGSNNPEIAQKLHAMLLKSGGNSSVSLPNVNSNEVGKAEVHLLDADMLIFGDSHCQELGVPNNEHNLLSIPVGSCGEVYRSEWNGTEVAVKKFMNQDISGDGLTQFKGEVEIMLRLRHPNVVLFMGAVTRPPNLSILTEYLPRGSLFRLLHRSDVQLDERRRMRMALDVAKGMNYLHTSNPIIVHRDLKTPNLLVDNNWVVKVCDFGMSRMKHNTFLSSKSTAGTPEWMAPEVLRNEPSNEKCDVYSFGVILWELATLCIPWTEMNSMQVVGAVGFQFRHLHIPENIDHMVAQIISDCWHLEPHSRPSFKEIIARLRNLKHLSIDRTNTQTSQ
ncbi:probable serine/threonine-protein kinase SIS8 isoform X2 [Rutidosis leptorrhynchoides]|uniref:probable serine/threonine-protein kinase SIS8 isoform X2 n=1 Tax=Rutidosis leptorrhynchoides TaxID=125765 RepID=UPI003A99560B